MSPKTRAVIADDEAPARQLIREYLGDFPRIEIVAECTDGDEAVRAINAERPDIAFLDVRMPGRSGFDVLTELDHLPYIIFTTAHVEFAVRAFEVEAVDYLLKPYDRERFGRAVERALSAARQEDVDRLTSLLERAQSDAPFPDPVFLRVSQRIFAVPVADILWVEAAGDYATVHTDSDRHFCTSGLGALEKKLDPERFVRVHRSAVVAVAAIRELESDGEGGYRARLRDGTEVRVSRSCAPRFRSLIP